ncbi:MAG: VOC family protein [Planctomycetaceae bacterium]
MNHLVFRALDHVAIAVADSEQALKLWRDRLGLTVVCSEVVSDGTLRLTHLDLGNVHLQLVEPLVSDHPLNEWLQKNGPGLHHVCFNVDDVSQAVVDLPEGVVAAAATPHQGLRGRRALFLDPATTQGVRVEITGA